MSHHTKETILFFIDDLTKMFWLDTYFDNETRAFKFSHSNDLVLDFTFIEPKVSL